MPKTSAPTAPFTANVKPSATYHHGDLRAALISAAREALETAPPESITLKSLALRLGVSQPAPYRHFDSREALLGAVAADGFVRFLGALAESVEEGSPESAIERSCLAYIAFGVANMGVYRLMFASAALRTVDNEALASASEAAFNFLLEKVAHHTPPERARTIAVWIWSAMHGLVMLIAEKMMSRPMAEHVTPTSVVHEMVRAFQLAATQPFVPVPA